MKCLRSDIITDLCQKIQEYQMSALAPKQSNFGFNSSFGPALVQVTYEEAAFAHISGLRRLLSAPNLDFKIYHSSKPGKEETEPKTEYKRAYLSLQLMPM